MRPVINVILDTKLFDSESENNLERTSKDEKKAVKWLKENSPVEIQIKYEPPFWSIGDLK